VDGCGMPVDTCRMPINTLCMEYLWVSIKNIQAFWSDCTFPWMLSTIENYQVCVLCQSIWFQSSSWIYMWSIDFPGSVFGILMKVDQWGELERVRFFSDFFWFFLSCCGLFEGVVAILGRDGRARRFQSPLTWHQLSTRGFSCASDETWAKRNKRNSRRLSGMCPSTKTSRNPVATPRVCVSPWLRHGGASCRGYATGVWVAGLCHGGVSCCGFATGVWVAVALPRGCELPWLGHGCVTLANFLKFAWTQNL
jgi:hypothetical protein